MSKRIKELATEVGISVDYLTNTKQIVLLEKFAELIVKECSKVIRHGGQRKGAFGNEDLRPSEIATMIEEHFGVD
jgi:hypothetical protein